MADSLCLNNNLTSKRTCGRLRESGLRFPRNVSDEAATWESTLSLLTRARAGDARALDDLLARYIPALQRWARGRLPPGARDLADTSDLVQETLIQVFKKIDGFEYRGAGALQAYLRQAVMNRIRNELRRAGRHPQPVALDEREPDEGLSPLEAAIGAETVERYEAALQRLREEERELVVARVELGLTYAEMADALQKPSADAARMAVGRALVRLAEEMRGPERPTR
jgi:RNA polymerase sigma-70 factor (ECF subfamily)